MTDHNVSDHHLTLDDVAEPRAYEREREAYRSGVIAMKKRRRVGIGPVMTLVFENRETMRFQVQEMARAERLMTDAAIQHELDTYNALIPARGELSATVFLELTDEWQMREWLPRLVGIETALELRLADGIAVANLVDAGHAAQLTRPETTAAVHYIRWALTPAEVDAFAAGGARIASTHHAYPHDTVVSDEVHAELLADLRG